MTAQMPAPQATRPRTSGPPASELNPDSMIRITLRPIGSSLPLGFLAFGAGTILLTALELHWVAVSQSSAIMVLVLGFVAPLELIAGVFAFLARDSGAATALSMLAAAWAGTAVLLLRAPAGTRSAVLGIFLIFLSAAMLLLSVSSMRAKPLFGVVLAAGACRFALTGAYQLSGSVSQERAAGWIGLPLLALCLYGTLALLLEEGAQRTVLPLARRGRARTSLEGDIGHQIAQAEQEPGIRRQL